MCNDLLTETNWHKTMRENRHYRCISCHNEVNKVSNAKIINVNSKYLSKKKHPELYEILAPGNYTKTKEGKYVLISATNDRVKDNNTEGYIYIAVNPAWPDMLKIGMTEDRDSRKSSLNTSVPYRDTTYAYTVKVKNMREAEMLAHKLAEEVCSLRLNEWFRMPVEQAIEILKSLNDENRKAA